MNYRAFVDCMEPIENSNSMNAMQKVEKQHTTLLWGPQTLFCDLMMNISDAGGSGKS